MGITGSIIIYVMIWWIVFFSVLPIGIQSNKETFTFPALLRPSPHGKLIQSRKRR